MGQIYMHSLCRQLPTRGGMIAALLSPDDRWSLPAELGHFGTIRLPRRYEHAFRPLRGPLGEAAALAGLNLRLQPHVRQLVSQAADAGRDAEIDAVIAVLESPAVLLMAARLADQVSVPLFSLVWDVPEHVLPGFGHRGPSARLLQQGFDNALRRSTGVAVMSSAMQRRFTADYGSRCTILRQPISDEWTDRRPGDAASRTGDFIIGFAGSVTAKDEMELLCRALDSVNWSLAGRRVRLRVFGLRYVCQAQTARWIEYRGYVPDIADVVAGLSECDVLFLPQPFGPEGRPFAEFSFPTKFTTYLAAQRPMLILAPAYSALAEFCRDHDLPILCDRPQEAAVLDHLQQWSSDFDRVADIEQRLRAVADSEFRPPLFRERISECLSSDRAATQRVPDVARTGVAQMAGTS